MFGATCASTDRCRGCPTDRAAVVPRSEPSEIAIVLDAPTDLEVRKEAFLAGPRGSQGSILRLTLEAVGLELEDVYVCSALNCRPNAKKKAMLNKAMNACQSRLVDELKEAGARKVLCVGPIGFGALMSMERAPAITKVRGKWHHAFGMQVMATLPPGFVLGAYEYYRDLCRDVEKFATTDGPEPYPEVTYHVPETLSELEDWIQRFAEAELPLGVDLETYGFSPVSKDVLAAGFCQLHANKRDADILIVEEALLSRKKTWRLLGRILNDPNVETVFHNAKFDLQFFKHQLETRGLRYAPANVHDTMLLSYALDERPMGKWGAHALESLARIRYDAPDYGIPMGKWLDEWEDADQLRRREMRLNLHEYLALDTYYTSRLFPDLWNECLEEGENLLDLYENFLMPGTLALAEVEYHGMPVDVPMLQRTLADLEKRSAKTLQSIRDRVGDPDFNPNSPVQVKKLVYEDLGMTAEAAMQALVDEAERGRVSSRSAKEGARSRGTYTDPKRLKESATAAPVLRMLARGHPEHEDLIEDICDYRNVTKNAGAYIKGWLDRLDEDGRLRGSFNLHGTATGRLSSSNPNLQNVPPSSHTGIPIRSAICAPPGRRIVGADYKQLEVRVAAQMSGDPAMYELFSSGGDVHAQVSKAIYNMPPEKISQYMRMLGKIVLFGLLYGRSPNSVATGPEQEDIVQRGGRRQTPEEVHEFFDNLLSEWAVYSEWRDRLRRSGYENGEVQLPSGRKRRFDFIGKHDGGTVGRQSLNTPVQGTASDVTLDALVRLQKRLPEGASVILTVHDALYVECWEEDEEEVTELIRDTMEDSPFFRSFGAKDSPGHVPLKADIKGGERWDEEDDKLDAGIVKK